MLNFSPRIISNQTMKGTIFVICDRNFLLKKNVLKTLFITFTLLFFISVINAQTIQVVNGKTGQPIEGVVLFTETFSTQTDSMGKAKIDNFSINDRILFKHSSYTRFQSEKSKIIKQGKIIWLNEDPITLNEIVISANRWEQSKAEIPNKIATINALEVEHLNPQTAADLVGTSAGAFS